MFGIPIPEPAEVVWMVRTVTRVPECSKLSRQCGIDWYVTQSLTQSVKSHQHHHPIQSTPRVRGVREQVQLSSDVGTFKFGAGNCCSSATLTSSYLLVRSVEGLVFGLGTNRHYPANQFNLRNNQTPIHIAMHNNWSLQNKSTEVFSESESTLNFVEDIRVLISWSGWRWSIRRLPMFAQDEQATKDEEVEEGRWRSLRRWINNKRNHLSAHKSSVKEDDSSRDIDPGRPVMLPCRGEVVDDSVSGMVNLSGSAVSSPINLQTRRSRTYFNNVDKSIYKNVFKEHFFNWSTFCTNIMIFINSIRGWADI